MSKRLNQIIHEENKQYTDKRTECHTIDIKGKAFNHYTAMAYEQLRHFWDARSKGWVPKSTTANHNFKDRYWERWYLMSALLAENVYRCHENKRSTEYRLHTFHVGPHRDVWQVLAIAGSNDWIDWLLNLLMLSWKGTKLCHYFEARRLNKLIRNKIVNPDKLIVLGHSKGAATALAYKKQFPCRAAMAFNPARVFRRWNNKPMTETVIFTDPDDPVSKLAFLRFGLPDCIRVESEDNHSIFRIGDHFVERWIPFLARKIVDGFWGRQRYTGPMMSNEYHDMLKAGFNSLREWDIAVHQETLDHWFCVESALSDCITSEACPSCRRHLEGPSSSNGTCGNYCPIYYIYGGCHRTPWGTISRMKEREYSPLPYFPWQRNAQPLIRVFIEWLAELLPSNELEEFKKEQTHEE